VFRIVEGEVQKRCISVAKIPKVPDSRAVDNISDAARRCIQLDVDLVLPLRTLQPFQPHPRPIGESSRDEPQVAGAVRRAFCDIHIGA
jgi:hypothetical protein